jgi:hypothetical protein
MHPASYENGYLPEMSFEHVSKKEEFQRWQNRWGSNGARPLLWAPTMFSVAYFYLSGGPLTLFCAFYLRASALPRTVPKLVAIRFLVRRFPILQFRIASSIVNPDLLYDLASNYFRLRRYRGIRCIGIADPRVLRFRTIVDNSWPILFDSGSNLKSCPLEQRNKPSRKN